MHLIALKNIALFILIIFATETNAQSYTPQDIPQIDLSFFKGSIPENTDYASMTFIDYSYRFAIEGNARTNEFKVNLALKVTPNSTKSYFDISRVKSEHVEQLLNHEQGHIVLGFIIGAKIEEALNACRYTKNYNKEIRANYKKFYTMYEKLQFQYDKETRHGADQNAQTKWNDKLSLLFKGD